MDDVTSPEALTGILVEIARITSVEVAIAMARWRGGRRLYIPTEEGLRHDHEIVKALGRRAALRIVRHFGRGNLAIPNAKAYLNWLDARRLRRQGLSASQISQRLKIGQRRVHILVAGVEPAPTSGGPLEIARCLVCGHKHRAGAAHAKTDPRQLELL